MFTRPKAVSTVFCDFRFRCGQINYRTNSLSSEIHDATIATDRAAVLVRHIRENAANTGTMNFKNANLLFIPETNEKVGKIHPILEPGWTLNYEIFFCLVLQVRCF